MANRRRRRSDRSRTVLPTVACRGANSRCAPATPSSQTVRRRTGRACGRRPVRGVRSEEGKSGLEARQAPSLGIRHRRTGQLVTETIPPCRSNHPRRRRHRQHTRRKTRFSTPSNRSEPIPDRPVSRRYEHVENALVEREIRAQLVEQLWADPAHREKRVDRLIRPTLHDFSCDLAAQPLDRGELLGRRTIDRDARRRSLLV